MEYPKIVTTPAGERLTVTSQAEERKVMEEATGVHAEDKTFKPEPVSDEPATTTAAPEPRHQTKAYQPQKAR